MTYGDAALSIRPTVSGATARALIDAALVEAERESLAVTVVVVDESGVLKGLVRMDRAPLVSVDGQPAGAIAVAGAMTGAEDRRIAQAAIAAAS